MKKIIILLSVTLIIFVVIVITMNIDISVVEQNTYINLNSNSVSEENKDKIIKKIDLIDTWLLTEFDAQNGVSNEFVTDVCNKYIYANYDYYKEKIIELDKEFVYEENETEYDTNLYINSLVFTDVVNKLFDYDMYDVRLSNYYDDSINCIALILKGTDEIGYDSKEIIKIKRIDNNEYLAEIKYNMDEENEVFLTVEYSVIYKEDEFVFKNLKVKN